MPDREENEAVDIFIGSCVTGTVTVLVLSSLNLVPWMTGCAILLLCFLIFAVLRLLKKLIEYLHTKFEIGELRRLKNNLLIIFGGMTICGWIPRIAVYFIATDLPAIWYCVVVSIITTFIVLGEFLPIDNWDKDTEKKKRFQFYSIVAHAILLLVTILIGCTSYTLEEGKTRVIFCQIGFSFICAPCTTELCMVLMGGVKLKKEGDQNQRGAQSTGNTQNALNAEIDALEGEAVIEAAKTVFVYPRIECNICMLEYNEASRTPRNLKECGHTVCQECADTLLKQNNGKVIFCPFCQNATVVNGPVSFLPKNYVALELIQERKND